MKRHKLLLFVTLITAVVSSFSRAVENSIESGRYAYSIKGDSQEAINIFSSIVESANYSEEDKAWANFELGKIYLLNEQKDLSNKYLQVVVENYESISDAVNRAKSLLNDSAKNRVKLKSVPWQDDEILEFTIFTPAASVYSIALVRKTREVLPTGRLIWREQAKITLRDQKASILTETTYDAETYLPIETDTSAMYFPGKNTKFKPTKLVIHNRVEDKVHTLNGNHHAYLNYSVFSILRRLPLRAGYETRIDVYSDLTQSYLKANIKVVDENSMIEIRGKKQQSTKLEIDMYSGDTVVSKNNYWVANDEYRTPLQQDFNGMTLRLTGKYQGKKDLPKKHVDASKHFEFDLPELWTAVTLNKNDRDQFETKVVPIEHSKINGHIMPEPQNGRTWSEFKVEESMGWSTDWAGKTFKDYKIREDSIEKVTINGHQAMILASDYELNGRKLVEYRANIHMEPFVLSFAFQALKEDFEVYKPTFETLVKSVRPHKTK